MMDARMIGIGGAPTRTTILPETAAERKNFPVASGFLDYFPDAIVAVSELSKRANDQHNPGQPLHWARTKSTDEADTLMRHFLQRGLRDNDGIRHSVKLAWRALALLQKEIEAEGTIKGAVDISDFGVTLELPPAQAGDTREMQDGGRQIFDGEEWQTITPEEQDFFVEFQKGLSDLGLRNPTFAELMDSAFALTEMLKGEVGR